MTQTQKIKAIITEAALKWGVDPKLAIAIAMRESSLNPNAVSHLPGDIAVGGSYGLMQVSRATAMLLMGGQTANLDRLLDPAVNANLGCMLLSQLQKRKGYTLNDVICAYNSNKPEATAPTVTKTVYLPHVLDNMKTL